MSLKENHARNPKKKALLYKWRMFPILTVKFHFSMTCD